MCLDGLICVFLFMCLFECWNEEAGVIEDLYNLP